MPRQRKYLNNAERQSAYRARYLESIRTQPGLSGQRQTRIPPSPGYRRWEGMIRQAASLLEGVSSEMGDYFEERSEGWQCSERGERLAERLESIEEIVGLMKDLT